jgi:hypothetical protein
MAVTKQKLPQTEETMKHSVLDADEALGRASVGMTAAVDAQASHLVEVWGDTVDIRHLAWSVALGIGISLGAFFSANYFLALYVHDAAMTRAYAMLVGLAGCLIAGAVCAKLFKPKRVVVDQSSDTARREEVLDQLAAEAGGLGFVADLPLAATTEMKELGLYDVFLKHEQRIEAAKRALDEGRVVTEITETTETSTSKESS